ncbi:STAS domain-containing protein [Novipirellula artificiosorum]|uniref:STAS domain-containing protein n=1 Tax=Novipirellula artificiosorum TaxID=2528016 RepID=A0A5C6CUW8_9BACT|nr:STAS domain-containing protein [Novipirellula artificiosorum]TWU28773.1 hypothetical protein Poly41_68760 [Novipirellula artificiosorum]
MIISSRTPEGEPSCCSVCGAVICMDPSRPAGDAPCPSCGHLLWFSRNQIARVDFEAGQTFDKTVAEQLSRAGNELSHSKLLLNFENVAFLSSEAITELVKLNETIHRGGGRLVLYNVRPNAMEVFKITKRDKLFHIVDSEQDSLASFD